MKKLKKTLSLFLTVCMLVGSISVTAFADEPQAENITSENNDTSKKVQTESDAQTENTTSADNDASGKTHSSIFRRNRPAASSVPLWERAGRSRKR